MILQCSETFEVYHFEHILLRFTEGKQINIFANKNNKTVRETLNHSRYVKLSTEAHQRYCASLDIPLGTFLLDLKIQNDNFYKKFLNAYGDLTYSTFQATDQSVIRRKGIYAYVSDKKIMYIGRCRDSISKRINQGYGKIHPKNCYIDGQSTNCHLNSLITSGGTTIQLWLCMISSDAEIAAIERRLIRSYLPQWNIHQFL